MDEERLAYSVDEAAALLGISRGLAWRMIREGKLQVSRLGRRVLVSRAAIEKLLQEGESK